MCGLTGIAVVHQGLAKEALNDAIRGMTDTLVHRGPDDAGMWVDEGAGIAIGHRRLAILDLSPAGAQPMGSESGRYQIVFNGEIYNFAELREELVGLDHGFRGHSDTEVLLAAIDEWGVEGAVKRCAGMFAFALWDRGERVLYLARDRLGEKPLYYGWIRGAFVFASELKALRTAPGWTGTLERDAVTLLFRFGYIPAPYSIYQGIYKLPPGTFLRLEHPAQRPSGFAPEAGDGAARPRRYWSVREAAQMGLADPIRDEQAAVEGLEEVLAAAVKRQMVADVPLGAFLSAGIDSATVVSLMQRQSDRAVKTFTIGFEEEGFNEARFAGEIASHLGTDHTELYATSDEALGCVPMLASIYDEPFADASQVPTRLLSALVRKHVTVCLTGDGGDELFGGYNRYWWSRRLWSAAGSLPLLARTGIAAGINAVPEGLWNGLFKLAGGLVPQAARGRQSSPAEKLGKVARALPGRDLTDVYRRLVSYWDDPAALVPGAREPQSVILDTSCPLRGSAGVEDMLYWDQSLYLPDDNLVKVDRASMSVSLETRVPLLDHRVVEYSWRIPLAMKYRDGVGKWVLRQVLYRHVPQALMERPKMGFSVPLGQWLRGGLRDWAEALLSEAALRRQGYLNPQPIRRMWQAHLGEQGNFAGPLWTVLMFQAWVESTHPAPRPDASWREAG